MFEMTGSGSASGDGTVGKRRARFNRWRRDRPFAGGALLILASLIIAWIPINIAPDTILLGKALSPVGLLFAALVFMCGMLALTRPELADIFGLFGILFSVFSLYGALGGLGLGLVVGLVGGNLCYAWEEDEEDAGDGSGGDDTTADDQSSFEFRDESDGDGSGGLFGTRSVRSRADETSVSRTGAGGRTASLSLLVVTVVVLSVFAQPLVVAAQQESFPDQEGIDGTIVIADEFSGQRFDHQNVTTDTSNRNRVSAGQFAFSSANIEGLTVYKNFKSGSGTPYHLTIRGSSSSAPNGLSLTTSEAYFGELGIGVDPVVVPAARNKWSTCPGQDFLFTVGDLGPLPGPPIDASNVVTNTHQLKGRTITIDNLNLTMQEGTKSTSVSGTPECTRNPVEPVLDLFTANALELLTDNGVIDSTTVTNSTLGNLSAPGEVNLTEPFDASATVTNTGYVNDTRNVEYRLDDETVRERTVSLAPNESTTVTFEDIDASGIGVGDYEQSIVTENSSVSDSLSIVDVTEAVNDTVNATNATGGVTNLTQSVSGEDATTGGETNSTADGNTTTDTADDTETTTAATTTTETTAEANESTATTTPAPDADSANTTSESEMTTAINATDATSSAVSLVGVP